MLLPHHPTTREMAIEHLAIASISGYLGLFVGSGFTKAATGDDAPGFKQLLELLVESLKLDEDVLDTDNYKFKSFPQIASQLLQDYRKNHPNKDKARDEFYEFVAQHCNLTPEASIGGELSSALKGTSPSWIITTNYDLILESLLEDSESVLPSQPLIMRTYNVPIYHIHGHRYNPSTIKITEEDYVSLLGPIDYQRLKLPLLLIESTTLMLGYALGDINVRAAMECSKSFTKEDQLKTTPPQGFVFQALYKNDPAEAPYLGPNGEIVLEIESITNFIASVASKRTDLLSQISAYSSLIQLFLADPTKASGVQENTKIRSEFLHIIQTAMPYIKTTKLIEFLDNTLKPLWLKARADGGFPHYQPYLELILDIIDRVDYTKINPGILAYLADCLNRVGSFLDPKKSLGSAFAATETWLERKDNINQDLRRELRSYAEAHYKSSLSQMLSW